MSDGAEFQTGLTPTISAALAGTDGSPSGSNRFVTDSDPRLDAGAEVDTETARALAAESALQDDIDTETAARIAADSSEASARAAADALKANLASPTFTGDPKAPTPSPGDDDTSIATTAFVQDALSGFSGDPTMGGDLSGTASNAQIVANAVTATEIAAGAVAASEIAATLKPSGSAAAGDEALRALGTSASTAAAGNDSRLSDARTPTAHKTSHQSGGSDAIKLDDLDTPDDNTDLNATSGHHGLLPKLSGSSSDVLKGDGSWGAGAGGDPAMGGDLSGTASNAQLVADSVTATEIAAGAVGASEISSALKPSGSAATSDEALRALGTGAGTAAAGNDARLSDSRAPNGSAGGGLTGTYPNPTLATDSVGSAQIAADAVGASEIAAGAVAISEISATLKPSGSAATTDEALRALGTAAGTAAAGNDSRLSDSRAPSGSAGGDLTGTYPNPTIGSGKVTLAQLAAAIKPSGSAAAGDEAVRALGTSASTAAAGNDSRLSPERVMTTGKAGSVTTTTEDADFYKAAPCALTLLRMKVTCRAVTTSMVVQLRKSTDSGANWSDVSGFTVTFASGDKIKVVDPSNVNLNEGDLLNFVASTVSGYNLLIDCIWVQQ